MGLGLTAPLGKAGEEAGGGKDQRGQPVQGGVSRSGAPGRAVLQLRQHHHVRLCTCPNRSSLREDALSNIDERSFPIETEPKPRNVESDFEANRIQNLVT